MPRTVRDIVLVRPHVEHPDLRFPMLTATVALAPDLTVGPIDAQLVKDIGALCDPHKLKGGVGDSRPPVRYAFCRVLPNTEPVAAFDPDGALTAAIAVSRLAHPTSVGFEWSVRVASDDGAPFEEAVPGFIKGSGAHAYVVAGSRDWLTTADAELTARLLTAYQAQATSMVDRVRRALWRHEYAARIEELDIRWLLVAGGLEALVKVFYPKGTPGPGSTRQFKARTIGLATSLALPWTEADAERAYELRSQVAHGAKVTGGAADLPLYAAMETLLRESLKRALLDTAFQGLFADDAAVQSAFPA